MTDWLNNPWTITIGGTVAATAIIGLTNKGRALTVRLWRHVVRRNASAPRTTVTLLPQLNGTWWHMGSKNDGTPIMQVVARLHATNLTERQIELLNARLRKSNTPGNIFVRHPTRDMYGRYPLIPNGTTELSCDFWVAPPFAEIGKSFKSAVIVVDQFGNEHRLGSLEFVYH